ncbi:PD-(D/E)XK nuclease family protein [Desulfovibrio sp. OttesenSCG-928-G11]|nr:PD-(D/E)XK nuclease family protein [Desulfovibrio sp. OttesenSCG-928-G11]
MNSQAVGWQNFFTDFKHYALDVESAQIPAMDAKVAGQFFDQFRHCYTRFANSGGTINVWDVAGIGTDEVRNCAVLGWLLDCHGSHGQGNIFLRWFIEAVNMDNIDATCRECFPQVNHIHAPYRTIVENTYAQEGNDGSMDNSRVDIVIESELFLLFIEAKIKAPKSGAQLTKYNEILTSRARQKRHGLIFLTCDGEPADGAPVGHVACVSWQQLAAAFGKRLAAADNAASPQLWTAPVHQFCQHIQTF